MSRAHEQVVTVAGGAWDASLNVVDIGSDEEALVLQVDRTVYVVGGGEYVIGRYDLDSWLGWEKGGRRPVARIEASTAVEAWDVLQLVREEATFVWQCGSCDAWIHTSQRPRVGVLACAVCNDGGVDFSHADRHSGSQG